MSNEFLVGIICALVVTHYGSMVWEIRQLKAEIRSLKDQVTAAALAAANAATAAELVASKMEPRIKV